MNTLIDVQTTETQAMALSVEKVVFETTLSESFIRNEIRAGNLKARKIGKRILVLRKDLEAYLENKSEIKITGEK